MAATRVILYGNSVFLAGLKAQLARDAAFELGSVDAGSADAADQILAHAPRAVIFDLAVAQEDFVVTLLRGQPGLLLIDVDPCSDELLILSGRPERTSSITDLIKIIR